MIANMDVAIGVQGRDVDAVGVRDAQHGDDIS